jgi:hypothetical protein
LGLYSLFRFRASELVDRLDREYADDLDALDAAQELCNEHTVEVYDANRFVARVKQGHELINVRDEADAGTKAAHKGAKVTR